MHHIVSDGWSVGILLRELAAHYLAATSGPGCGRAGAAAAVCRLCARPAPTPGRGGRYRARPASGTGELKGAPEALTLPLDGPRPAIRSDAGSTREIVLPPELAASVAAFARAHRATPFIVLSAAWAALLSRWSGQDDIVIGRTDRQPGADRGPKG